MKRSHPELDGHFDGLRVPPIIEFAGTPRAGKTTAMRGLARRLKARGRRVGVVTERAGQCPIPSKLDPRFSIWTAARTLADLQEAQFDDKDVVLIDRGVFDALCWIDWYASKGALAPADQEGFAALLRAPVVARPIGLVLVLTVEPREAMRRHRAGKPSASPGSIVNAETLQMVNRCIESATMRHSDEFTLLLFDTTSVNAASTLDRITDAVLDRYPGLGDGGRESLVLQRGLQRSGPSG